MCQGGFLQKDENEGWDLYENQGWNLIENQGEKTSNGNLPPKSMGTQILSLQKEASIQ